MTPTTLLEGIIYIAGVSFVFFAIPSLALFGLTEWLCRRIEKAPRKVGA